MVGCLNPTPGPCTARAGICTGLEEGNEENRDRAALYFAAYLGIMHSLFDYSDEQYALALIEYASLKADYADRMALYEVAKGLVEAREGRYHLPGGQYLRFYGP